MIILNTGCQSKRSVEQTDASFADNSFEIEKLIENHSSEIDYSKFLKIKINDIEIKPYHITQAGDKDYKHSNIIYTIRVDNIVNEKIGVNLKLFISKEIEGKIIYGLATFGPHHEDIVLEKGVGIDIYFVTLMKNINLLTDAERELLNTYKNKLYAEIQINGKKDYIELQYFLEEK